MPQNIYIIDQRLRAIIDALEAAQGEITPEIEAEWNDLKMNREEWLEQAVAAYHETLSQSERYRSESARISELRKTQERIADTIRRRIFETMVSNGDDKIVTTTGNAAIRTNPPSVILAREIEDEPTRLPHKFLRVVTQYSADKKAIIAAAEAGETLPDGVQVVRAKRLDIK